MITAGELRKSIIEGQFKIPDDEPVFLLRAQDQHAADLVEKWTIWVSTSDVSCDKVGEARLISDLMRRWPIHKPPD
jgi:hypothetical protein